MLRIRKASKAKAQCNAKDKLTQPSHLATDTQGKQGKGASQRQRQVDSTESTCYVRTYVGTYVRTYVACAQDKLMQMRQGSEAKQGKARRGKAKQGKARRGEARQGMARKGSKASKASKAKAQGNAKDKLTQPSQLATFKQDNQGDGARQRQRNRVNLPCTSKASKAMAQGNANDKLTQPSQLATVRTLFIAPKKTCSLK